MVSIQDVETGAKDLSRSIKIDRRWALISATAVILLFLAGLAVFSGDASLFSRWGAIGVGIALV